MYPHERSLVSRLQGQPFVFLGVNSDKNRDKLRRTIAEQGITWRSWWDGATDGPIATRWQVDGWPALYVLDAKGVIRYRVRNAPQLERAVTTLLKEMESHS
jgi:hypothetical protein